MLSWRGHWMGLVLRMRFDGAILSSQSSSSPAMPNPLFKRLAPHCAVGDDDLNLVVCHELCPEQRQFLDGADETTHLHPLADPERADHEEHHACGQIREGSLKSQTDGKSCSADHRDEAGRLNA